MMPAVASPTYLCRESGTGVPSLGVVIPVYNGAIASIQAQTVGDIRIIVVSDGPTDGTRQIVKRRAATDARVMLVDQPNGGIVDALNAGTLSPWEMNACHSPAFVASLVFGATVYGCGGPR